MSHRRCCHDFLSHKIVISIAEAFPAAGTITSGWTELGRQSTSPHPKVASDESSVCWERSPDSLSNFQCWQQVDDKTSFDDVHHCCWFERKGRANSERPCLGSAAYDVSLEDDWSSEEFELMSGLQSGSWAKIPA